MYPHPLASRSRQHHLIFMLDRVDWLLQLQPSLSSMAARISGVLRCLASPSSWRIDEGIGILILSSRLPRASLAPRVGAYYRVREILWEIEYNSYCDSILTLIEHNIIAIAHECNILFILINLQLMFDAHQFATMTMANVDGNCCGHLWSGINYSKHFNRQSRRAIA